MCDKLASSTGAIIDFNILKLDPEFTALKNIYITTKLRVDMLVRNAQQ